ncbi:MAG: holo-[acyl-carrier-protein] synthase [Deltaproteobacteria bacterium GWC2_42_11]|nr:MAG: holo-[acyl-carrier-protein] synthase [Deltaproteobacteria bacterium GWC2_42_11]HBO83674.1 holo-[acyl-carrier-protein] synthase [Deltaproteobacteria bacterium]
MIHGIGIDIVHIPKFKNALLKWGDRLKERIFTLNELNYCEKRAFPEQHLAVRFATKEAFFKALGSLVGFKDIEVLNDGSNKPYINVINKNVKSKNRRTYLSLSHDGDYCIAQVLIEVV